MKKGWLVVLLLVLGGCDGRGTKGVLPDLNVGAEPPDANLLGVWTFKSGTMSTDCPEGAPDKVYEQEVRIFLEKGECRLSDLEENWDSLHRKNGEIIDIQDTTCKIGGQVLTTELLSERNMDPSKPFDIETSCKLSIRTGGRFNFKEESLSGNMGAEIHFIGRGCLRESKDCSAKLEITALQGRRIEGGTPYAKAQPPNVDPPELQVGNPMGIWTLKTGVLTTNCPEFADINGSELLEEQEIRFSLVQGRCLMSNLDADGQRMHHKKSIPFNLDILKCNTEGNVLTLSGDFKESEPNLDCERTAVGTIQLKLQEGTLTGNTRIEYVYSGTECPEQAIHCINRFPTTGVLGRQIVGGKEYGPLPPPVP